MICVVDSSVFLRKLLSEPQPLKEWNKIKKAYVSRLVLLEIPRVVDRYRLQGKIDDREVVELHLESRRLLKSAHVVSVSEEILLEAARPMPTVLGSLDAIHLATALELRRELSLSLTLATHDDQLAAAARASGFNVVG